MLISELEAQLKELREKHGDLPIKMCWNEFHMSFDPELPVSDLWKVGFLGDHVLFIPDESLEINDYRQEKYNVTK